MRQLQVSDMQALCVMAVQNKLIVADLRTPTILLALIFLVEAHFVF